MDSAPRLIFGLVVAVAMAIMVVIYLQTSLRDMNDSCVVMKKQTSSGERYVRICEDE